MPSQGLLIHQISERLRRNPHPTEEQINFWAQELALAHPDIPFPSVVLTIRQGIRVFESVGSPAEHPEEEARVAGWEEWADENPVLWNEYLSTLEKIRLGKSSAIPVGLPPELESRLNREWEISALGSQSPPPIESRSNTGVTWETIPTKKPEAPLNQPITPAESYRDIEYVTFNPRNPEDVEALREWRSKTRNAYEEGTVEWEKETGFTYTMNAIGDGIAQGRSDYVEDPTFLSRTILAIDRKNDVVVGGTLFSIDTGRMGWQVHGSYIGTTGKTLGVGTGLIREIVNDPLAKSILEEGGSLRVQPANEKVGDFYHALGFEEGGYEFVGHKALAFGSMSIDDILAKRLQAIGLPSDVDADVAKSLEQYKVSVGDEIANDKGLSFLLGFSDGVNRGNKELGVPRMGVGVGFDIIREETLDYIDNFESELKTDGGTTFGGEFHPWASDIPDNLRNKLFQSLYLGVAKGKSMDQIADEIQEVMGNEKWQAVRIARTEIAASQFEGMKKEYKESGFTHVKWLLGKNPCDVCDAYGAPGNNIYPIDKCPTIPVHPNCRCDIAPVDETDAEIELATDKMAALAKEQERKISPDVMEAFEEAGAKAEGYEFRLKERDSLNTKILKKYVEALRQMEYKDYDLPVSEYRKFLPNIQKISEDIDDNVRYTAIVPQETYSTGMRKVYDTLIAKGYTPVKEKNYWNHVANGGNGNGGYKGMNTIWKTPDGYEFELQFHTPKSWEVKQYTTHDIYKMMENTTDPTRKAMLAAQIQEIYKSVPTPEGAETWVYKQDIRRGVVRFTRDDWIRSVRDVNKSQKAITSHMTRFYDKDLTDAERNAIDNYVEYGYNETNRYLYGGAGSIQGVEVKPGESIEDSAYIRALKKRVKLLDNALTFGEHPPEGVELWRGVGSDYGIELSRQPVGTIIENKAYTSVSYNPNTAVEFSYPHQLQDFEVDEILEQGITTRDKLLATHPTTVLRMGEPVHQELRLQDVQTIIRVLDGNKLTGLYIGPFEGEILVTRGQKFQIVDKSWYFEDVGRLREIITVIPVN